MRSWNLPSFVVFGLLALMVATGCRGPRQRALTKEQERIVSESVLTAQPTPQVPIGANFDDKLRLIGVDVDKAEVRPGDSVTVTWYWESLAKATGDWKLFVHFEGRGRREPFDHDPVGELMPISRLEPGQIIKDVQVLRVPADFPEGEVKIWTGVFDIGALRERQQDIRMVITNAAELKVPNEPNNRLLAAVVNVSKNAKADSKAKVTPPAPAKVDRKPRRYTVNRAPGPIVVDGKLDDAGWQGIARFSDFVVPAGGAALADEQRPEAKMTWDAEYLYVSFYNPDRDIKSGFTGRDSRLWEADVIEIYLDPGADGKDYLELQVAPTGEIFDAKFTTQRLPKWEEAAPAFTIDLNAKVAIDGTLNAEGEDKSWTVEVAIPFAGIPGGAPENNTAWSVNLYRLDETFHAAWAPLTRSDYHELSSFGRVTFVTNPPLGTTP